MIFGIFFCFLYSMNYLGHLYFSFDNPQLQYANLFGDFVKGSHLDDYPLVIKAGIKLHRTIDSYIDNHQEVKELMHNLYEPLPKIAGIAIDLYFDHLLARNWNDYHPLPLDDFIEKFYQTEIENQSFFSKSFLDMTDRMKRYRWLNHYKTHEGLEKMCQGVSNRVSFDNELINAPIVFMKNEETVTETFKIYMKDAIQYFKEYKTKELAAIL